MHNTCYINPLYCRPPKKTDRLREAAYLAAVPFIGFYLAANTAGYLVMPFEWLYAKLLTVLLQLYAGLTGAPLDAVYYLQSDYTMLICGMIAYVFYLFVPFFVFAKVRGIPRSETVGKGRPPLSAFAVAVCGGLGLAAVASYLGQILNAVLMLFGLEEVESFFLVPYDGVTLVLQILSVALLPAICEEYAVRGVALRAVEPTGGTWFAVVYTSVMFALLHGTVLVLPLAILFGLFAAWLRVRYDSIWPGVLAHFVINLSSILFETAVADMAVNRVWIPYTLMNIGYLLLGAAAVLILLAAHGFSGEELTGFARRGERSFASTLGVYLSSPTTIVFLVLTAISIAYSLAYVGY